MPYAEHVLGERARGHELQQVHQRHGRERRGHPGLRRERLRELIRLRVREAERGERARVSAAAAVALGAAAARAASVSNHSLMNCSNDSRLIGVEHRVAAHVSCAPGGTQREHASGSASYAARVGALRQKFSKSGTDVTAFSTRRMKSSRACSSTFPPGGLVSYTVVSQYAACDCLRSTSGTGGGAFAGAGGAGGPLNRRVCALDHCSAASTLS